MENEKKENPYGAKARPPLHSRDTKLSSPKSSAKQRAHSSPGQTPSPLLGRCLRDEIPDCDNSHNDESHASENDEMHSYSYSSSKSSACGRSGSEERSLIQCRAALQSCCDDLCQTKQSTNARNNLSPETVLKNIADPDSTVWIFCVVVSVCIAISVVIFLRQSATTPKERFRCPQFKELQKYLPHQDELLWKSLKNGIENVLNESPAEPSVFLLVYSDIRTTQNVMQQILKATANCMNTTKPIQLNGETFATPGMISDYGEIIEKYRDELEHEKIMYVSDVNRTPAAAAQVFHTICDTVTPLVKKAVIFFTVHMDADIYLPSPADLLQKVEQKLKTNWHQDENAVSENTLEALIGRVTDQVFFLRSENVST